MNSRREREGGSVKKRTREWRGKGKGEGKEAENARVRKSERK